MPAVLLGFWVVVVAAGGTAGLLVRGPETGRWMFLLVMFSAACVGVLQQALP